MNGFTYRLMNSIVLLALTFGGYVNANVSPALLASGDLCQLGKPAYGI